MNDTKFITILWTIRKLITILTPFLFICLIVTECNSGNHDIDHAEKRREIFSVERVVDSTSNGFEVVYVTKEPVTKYRLKEMTERKYILRNIARMKDTTIRYFNNLLYTDIYVFTDFIKPIYIDSNLVIESVYVYGIKKNSLYIGKNPNIQNSAKWFDPNTGQGGQYIKHNDIYYRRKNERIYRYYKCYGIFDMSFTDERFSHFSEDERVY